MKKIAVTGAYLSGKSTVCQIFADHGAFVIDADKIAHQLLNGPCFQAVVELLGPDVAINHTIDRQKVAQKVFNNKDQLKNLENILHPQIFKTIQDEYNQANANFFVAEIPLLFEAHWDPFFDITICVIADQARMQEHPDWGLRKQHQFLQICHAR